MTKVTKINYLLLQGEKKKKEEEKDDDKQVEVEKAKQEKEYQEDKEKKLLLLLLISKPDNVLKRIFSSYNLMCVMYVVCVSDVGRHIYIVEP